MYEFLEDVSIAEVAFRVVAKSIEELFKDSALALTNVQIRNLESIENREKREIEIKEENIEFLLFSFLQQLVILKDSERLLFNKFEINIEKNDKWKLKAVAFGEEINPNKHDLLADVKGISLHKFEVKKVENSWIATIVVDI
ncbi:MAG: archease [Candidatus Aenigmarchaeota archaeon]|nr:archease [Candidatus Aenigmarchaeota archaeon]MDW8149519.1 archease [Candidatus Aenigmarchaeota archaeon]